jgi:hypothetical protein
MTRAADGLAGLGDGREIELAGSEAYAPTARPLKVRVLASGK